MIGDPNNFGLKPGLNELQYFFTDYLKAGEWRLTDNCLMVGRGTDMEDLIFKMNLTQDDLEFLNGCRIAV